MSVKTRIIPLKFKLILVAVGLVLVLPPTFGALGVQLNVPMYKLVVEWKGNPLGAAPRPMAISYVVGALHKDVVATGGRWVMAGVARREEHLVVVGVGADPDALARCEIWVSEDIEDEDPGHDEGIVIDGRRWVNSQVFCEAWVPDWP
jgi:hypothetical protein